MSPTIEKFSKEIPPFLIFYSYEELASLLPKNRQEIYLKAKTALDNKYEKYLKLMEEALQAELLRSIEEKNN